MGGDPGKVIRNVKGAAQKYLGVGFLLGFFLVLLTYFTVSEQFAITAPNGEFNCSESDMGLVPAENP
jgi:hypothetical protein